MLSSGASGENVKTLQYLLVQRGQSPEAPLARGATGSAVQGVQSQLFAHGIQVSVDGAFGPGTQAGVTSFQSSAGLPTDGMVDARTWSRLLA
ncbi:peptidoglycan-binding domain-containing protein [Kitasatospora aureofaciens]|uniref:peptidoglycan-binding domain-containing protein n=1 Tax=Kitasatospora aureofaciens TaxID=1894 RepID=UPI0033AA61BE